MENGYETMETTEPNHLKGYTKKFVRRKEKKKDLKKDFNEIKGYIKEGKAIIGTERTLKSIKLGKIQKVYYSQSIAEETFEALEHYSNINEFEMIPLEYKSKEVGANLNKPFNISIIGILK